MEPIPIVPICEVLSGKVTGQEDFCMEETMLVTGGSGFLGAHVVLQLLEEGHAVRATVRDLSNASKLVALRDMQMRFAGKLELFEADLLVPGSFMAAMQGCSVVHHVASPFLLPEQIVDGRRQVLEPALLGTRNVLESVNQTPSVTRVVMTSAVGAIFGDYADVQRMDKQTLSESYFNTSSTLDTSPCHYAKTESEKEAWRMCQAQSRWDLVTINPGMIFGPSLSPHSESGSLFLIDEMLKGYFIYGMPDLSLTTVDVREVAQAHVHAAINPSAKGRYILAHETMATFSEISEVLQSVHQHDCVLPTHQIPDSLVKLLGPLFGLTQNFIRKHLGIRFAVNNRRSRNELWIDYRPLVQTLVDHYQCWATQRSLVSSPQT